MRILASLLFLAPSLAAEVHTVGPAGSGSDFEVIQDAIDFAAAGDVVLVAPGDYEGFTLEKPVLVQGAGSGLTTVTAAYGWVTAILVKDIAAGEVAIAAGMSVQMSALPWAGIGVVESQASEGVVVLHDVRTADGALGVIDVLQAQRLVLSRAAFLGSESGTDNPVFRAQASRVWLVDSHLSRPTITAGSLLASVTTARLVDSEGFLAGCTLLGADIDPEWILSGGNALKLQGSVAVADRFTALGGNGATAGAGGFGAWLTSASSLLVGADAFLKGGLDGSGLVEQQPLLVDPGSSFVQGSTALPTLSASPGLATAGGTLELTLHGDAGGSGHLFASLAPGSGAVLPGLVGDVFLDLSAPLRLGAVTLDAAGEAHLAFQVPALPEPTLATFQWASVSTSVELSNPAFVSVN